MDEAQFGRELAELLSKHAPPKIEGGSPERRRWIGLVISIQMALFEQGMRDVGNALTEFIDG